MNTREKILQKFALIQDKQDFLNYAVTKKGFENCKCFIDSRNPLTYKKEETLKTFLKMIEEQLKTDNLIRELKVKNYKIITDDSFY